MKKIAVLLLVVFAVLPAFTQAEKSNHDFKSSVNTVTNGMFKEDVDKVLDVTGFNAIEGNIIGTQITNKTALGSNKTDLDFVWGKKFDWFYLGAGYNGSIIAQTGTNNTIIEQNNNYNGPGNEWTGSTTATGIKKGVEASGFSNNAQVLFGFNNMGFKLSFDSFVPKGVKRGSLDSSLNLRTNTTAVRTGDAINGTYTDTVYDAKGFSNFIYEPATSGTPERLEALWFKPHLDFGVNLGMGMGLWVTAHAGLDIVNWDSYNGNTETKYTTVIAAPDFTARTTSKNYQHLTQLGVIAGAEVGATFGIVEPSFAYDFGVRLNIGKTFAEDKKTAFIGYTQKEETDNSTGIVKTTSNYTGAAMARGQLWHNKIVPAVKVSPDFGDKVKFALKVSVPVSINSNNNGKSGLDELRVTSYEYKSATAPNDIVKQTIETYENDSYNTLQTVVAPVVEMGMRIYTPSEKMSFNFGVKVLPFEYIHTTNKKTVADNANKTTTVYANGDTAITHELPPVQKNEYKNSTDSWKNVGIETLANVRVGFTWYVNTKLTFDMDFSVLGAAKSLIDNPFYNKSGSEFKDGTNGTVGLTVIYKY